jgi:hypothetical protein
MKPHSSTSIFAVPKFDYVRFPTTVHSRDDYGTITSTFDGQLMFCRNANGVDTWSWGPDIVADFDRVPTFSFKLGDSFIERMYKHHLFYATLVSITQHALGMEEPQVERASFHFTSRSSFEEFRKLMRLPWVGSREKTIIKEWVEGKGRLCNYKYLDKAIAKLSRFA